MSTAVAEHEADALERLDAARDAAQAALDGAWGLMADAAIDYATLVQHGAWSSKIDRAFATFSNRLDAHAEAQRRRAEAGDAYMAERRARGIR